jgi:hypothetical protein
MSILLQLKNAAVALSGPLFRTAIISDMATIESEVNNLDVAVNGLTQNVTTSWVSGTTYAINDFRRSPINFQTYRRLTAGAGTVDPSADMTNWVAVAAGNVSQAYSVGPAITSTQAPQAGQIQSGVLISFTTGGTGTAYTLTPAPAITAYAANQEFNVIFTAACGAAPTLQINGIATPPNLVKQNQNGTYSNLAAGDFPAGWQSPVKLVSATQALVLCLPSAMVKIATLVAAASAVIDFTGIDGANYSKLLLVGQNINASVAGQSLLARLSTGSGFIVTGYYSGQQRIIQTGASSTAGDNAVSAWEISPKTELWGTASHLGFELNILNVNDGIANKAFAFTSNELSSNGANIVTTVGGGMGSFNSATVDGIRILPSTGTIVSGTFTLYGIRG